MTGKKNQSSEIVAALLEAMKEDPTPSEQVISMAFASVQKSADLLAKQNADLMSFMEAQTDRWMTLLDERGRQVEARARIAEGRKAPEAATPPGERGKQLSLPMDGEDDTIESQVRDEEVLFSRPTGGGSTMGPS